MRKLLFLLLLIPGIAPAQQVQPGLWAWSSKITSMSGPRVPPSMVASLKSEPPAADKQCLSPAEAKEGFVNMLRRKSPDCSVTSNTLRAGSADILATWKSGGRSPMTMHLHGPFSPTAFSLTADSHSDDMTMSMIFSAKRVGACG